jgi:hypothetical protein
MPTERGEHFRTFSSISYAIAPEIANRVTRKVRSAFTVSPLGVRKHAKT